ncbi:MAG TPA: antibiotic biosynthesis monooxygenase [Thermoanaerobaculia bacterium]|jgi:heme-degrading monooxygenase HmoA|nr:antibiotic biosynthesis monooxygenase [Thermoanaerobaculia bacterium]
MKKITLVFTVLSSLTIFQCATTHKVSPAHVARMWRGEVPLARADEYQAYLDKEGLTKLRSIRGNQGVQMFRRTVGDREEFVVISYWPDEAAIRAYAGEDVLRARLMPRDPEFLIEPDTHVRHYRIVVDK